MKLPRILLLTGFYYPIQGGIETHARQIAIFMQQHGFQPIVVTKRVRSSSEKSELIDGVRVIRVRPSGERTLLQRWMMVPFAIFKMFRLRKEFDLIYCVGFRGTGLAALAIGKILRKPVLLKSGNDGVLSCENWDSSFKELGISPSNLMVRILKAIFRKIYSSADGYVCFSKGLVKEARSCNIEEKKIHYLPEVIDCNRFKPAGPGERDQIRVHEGWPTNKFISMYVGRLSTEKGIIELLEAWSLVPRGSAVLVVIGPDMPGHSMDAGPWARKLVEEKGMMNDVIFCGARDDISILLRAADLFIQPSHYEAFGISVIEAMASGLPIVANAVGGMMDYLEHGVNGLLCSSLKPNDIAEPILCLMNDPALHSTLGKNARQTIEEKFQESVVYKKFSRLFIETSVRGGVSDSTLKVDA